MKRWVSLVLLVTVASCTDETTSPDPVEKRGEGCELSPPALPAPLADVAGPNFGRFNGTFGVSPSGEATYSLALEVPPGPSGLSPELALEYRTSEGEQYVGRGWSLAGFSSLARCNPNLRDDNVVEGIRYDSSDPLCLDGKRLYQTSLNGNDRIYRTRPDTFVKVVAHDVDATGPKTFTVYARSGTRYEYGTTPDSRALAKRFDVTATSAPGDLVTNIWMVSEAWSPATQARMTYEYSNILEVGDGYTREIVPKAIRYGDRAVTFEYGNKLQYAHRESYSRGMRFTQQQELLRIKTSVDNGERQALRYELTYGLGPRTYRDLLAGVRVCSGPICQPFTQFTYASEGRSSDVTHWSATTTTVPAPNAPKAASTLTMDVTGDGLADLVTADTTSPPSTNTRWTVARNLGNGGFAAPEVALVEPMLQTPPVTLDNVKVDRGTAIDYDQDGLQDLLLLDVEGKFPTWHVLKTTRNAANHVSFSDFNTQIPRPFGGTVPPALTDPNGSAHLADFNGDGVSDLVQCHGDSTQTWSWKVFFWRAPPWLAVAGFDPSPSSIHLLDHTPCHVPVFTLDVDHDGRVDLVTHNAQGAQADGSYQIGANLWAVGSRDGEWHAWSTKMPVPSGQLAFFDVNGDGALDALQTLASASTNVTVYINRGGTFLAGIPGLPSGGPSFTANLALASPLDVDGDGRQDLLLPVTLSGDLPRWKVLHAEQSPTPLRLTPSNLPDVLEFQMNQAPRLSFSLAPRAIDADANGGADVLMFSQGKLTYFRSQLRDEDLLATVTNATNAYVPTNAKFRPDVAITYGRLVDTTITDGVAPTGTAVESRSYIAHWDPHDDCTYPRRCVVGGRPIVTGYVTNNGNDAPRTFELRYRDARLDRAGHGWLGFGTRLLIDRDTGRVTQTTYDHAPTVFGDLAQIWEDFPRAQLIAEERIWTPALPGDPAPKRVDLRVVRTERKSYNAETGSAHLSYFEAPSRTTISDYQGEHAGTAAELAAWARTADGGAASLVKRRRVELEYDQFANPIRETSTTDGVAEIESFERKFWNEQQGWIIGRTTEQRHCSGGQCRVTTFEHDANGMVTRQRSAADGSSATLELTIGYDAFANPVKVSATSESGETRSACAVFDDSGTYMTGLRDGVGNTAFVRYDSRWGTPSAAADANGRITQWRYDLYGRLVETQFPDGTKSTVTRTWATDPLHGNVMQIATAHTGAPTTTIEYDQRNREVVRWTDNVQPYCTGLCLFNPRIAEYTEYEGLYSQVSRRSLPVNELIAYANVPHWYRFTYDAARRLVERRAPYTAGVTTYRYTGLAVEEKEPLNVIKSAARDGADRIVSVTDATGTTKFTYGPFSTLAQASAPGSTTHYTHDAWGLLRVLDHPDRGVATYDYDGFGGLVASTDALGRKTRLAYDAVGRLTVREDDDGIATYKWDAAPNGIGELAETTLGDTTRTYAYTPAGQLASDTLLVGGESFVTSRTYDSSARLSKLGFPGGFQIRRVYDSRGHLIRILNDATSSSLWSLTGVDGASRPTQESFGNGTVTTRTYQVEKLALQSLVTKLGSTQLQSLSYVWNDRVQLTSRADALQGKTESFGYDPLDRLTCTSFGSLATCAVAISYDASGNIVSKSDVGGYVYTAGDQPHAVRAAGAAVYDYDLVGNQIERPDATLEYTARNLLARVAPVAGTATTYTYDAHGTRVTRTTAGEAAVQDGRYERVTRTTGVDHYYSVANDERVFAVLARHAGQPDRWTYIHSDHLGSPDVLTDGSGAVTERRSFDAFGLRRSPVWGQSYSGPASKEPLGYTGHHEDALGLVDMRGRTYDPRTGRFLQADPIVSRPRASQSWNAYSYVGNRPLRYVDPTGYSAVYAAPTPPAPVTKHATSSGPDPAVVPVDYNPDETNAETQSDDRDVGTGVAQIDMESIGTTSVDQVDAAEIGAGDMDLMASGSFMRDIRRPVSVEDQQEPATDAADDDEPNHSPVDDDDDDDEADEADDGPGVFSRGLSLAVGIVGTAVGIGITVGETVAVETGAAVAGAAALVGEAAAGAAELAEALIDPLVDAAKEKANDLLDDILEEAKKNRKKRWTREPTDADRGKVFERQGGDCAYCGRRMTRRRGGRQFNLDHPNPFSKYGPIDPLDGVGSCRDCNLDKSDMEFEDWVYAVKDALDL